MKTAPSLSCLPPESDRGTASGSPGSAITPRLLVALLLKALLEIGLLVFLASLTSYVTFPPGLRGAIDRATPAEVRGWAFNEATPRDAVTVQLFLNGRFEASVRADSPRPDLVTAGVTSSPGHGFVFSLEGAALAPGPHRVEVFALHFPPGGTRVLIPLSTSPRSFWVER
ncbi:MAG: hypothetical protein ACOYNR_05575 [Blastocatellia bacterium]|jgi:hypothetical protein